MDYNQTIDFIDNKMNYGCKPGLETILILLELLGNPQKQLKVVHVAGTNGKGSTTAMISNILTCAGYKTGMYTSPHLYSIRERLIINGEEITELDFVRYAEIVIEKMELMKSMGKNEPTQFELITAMAFLYFHEKQIDLLVLEVGLGGALDATNVVDSILSIITSISYDHTEILGDTIEKIAFEKAGIIKSNSRTVLYPQLSIGADRVVEEVCINKNAKLTKVKREFGVIKDFEKYVQRFDFINGDFNIDGLRLPLIGDHQILNACTCITAILELKGLGYKISDEHIRIGLETVKWPCRLTIVKTEPLIIIDGAHNEDGIDSLTNALKKYFNDREVVLVIGMLKDKNYEYAAQKLAPLAVEIITTTPESQRALEADILAKTMEKYSNNVSSVSNLSDAIAYAISKADKKNVICISGSLYLAGEAYKVLKTL